MTRVVIADDSLLLREGLALLLGDAGFEVVGGAGDAAELVELVRATRPDLAVIDIRMPPTFTTEGVRVASSLRRQHPQLRVVLLSQHIETLTALELLDDDDGGVGYLLKDRVTDIDDFLRSLHRVAAGGTAIDPDVIRSVVRRARAPHHSLAKLTLREVEVLTLMSEGLSNTAIATSLTVSERTVEAHVRSTFTKLGLEQEVRTHRRVQAVLAFLSVG